MIPALVLADGGGQATNATLLLIGAAFIGWLAVRAIRGRSRLGVPRAVAWVGVVVAVALAVVALLLPSLLSSSPTAGRPASTGRIEILAPTVGQIYHGTTDAPAAVVVELRVTGARIVPFTTTRLRPDEGHVHLFLDGALVSMTSGTTTTLEGGPGSHVLQAEFVAADHGPFDPPIQATVRFEVRP
jgi:hypothetical protein